MSIDDHRLGVDLGTSNTAAVLRGPDGRIRPVLFDGLPQLPSAVYLDAQGGFHTGRDALYAARTDPQRVELYPKQRIDEGAVLLGTVEVPVADLIAAVLRRVAADATPDVRHATLTCPASWGEVRRGVLRAAAAQVFDGVDLVDEPVAAASYFVSVAGSRLATGQTALVYDLGAGTFDAAVLRRTGDGFEILAADGLPDAGGLDVDTAIVGYLGATFSARDPDLWRRLTRPDRDPDRRAARQLWDDVRSAKEVLSRVTATRIPLPLFDDDPPLGREQFDQLAGPVLGRTVMAARSVLREAGVAPAGLGGLYLVGGASRIPLVATLLHRSFGIAPTVVEQPELAVAEGSLHVDRVGAAPLPPVPQPLWAPEPPPEPPPEPARRPARNRRTALVATIAVAALLAAAGAVWAFGRDPNRPPAGLDASSAAPSAPVSPSRSMTPEECVVGTWDQVRITYSNVNYYGTTVTTTGSGSVYVYRADGTGRTELNNTTYTGQGGGNTYEEIHNGWLTWRYRAGSGRLIFTDTVTSGTATIKVNGRVRETHALRVSGDDSSVDYACDATGMSISSESYTLDLRRR